MEHFFKNTFILSVISMLSMFMDVQASDVDCSLEDETRNFSVLPVNTHIKNAVGKSRTTYEIEGRTFQLQNVEGRVHDCFFNATGLQRKEEQQKLLNARENPKMREIIANEIVASLHNPKGAISPVT